MRVVGDLVGQIGQLGLERGRTPEQEALADPTRLARLQPFGIGTRAMLEDALARLEAEVEPVEGRIALLERIDHAQALHIVFEAAARLVRPRRRCLRLVALQTGIERILAGMAEGGMAQVMRERDRLDQVLVQAQAARDAARQLRHLERMGQPGAEQVALVVQEDLGLVDQAPERARMDDAVAVALEIVARRRRPLGKAPPLAACRIARIDLQALRLRRSRHR